MNIKTNNSPLSPHFHLASQTKKPPNPEYKARPISALLSLKILNNEIGLEDNQSLRKIAKRDRSLEQLERQKNNFNKTFILPEIEAKNQSFIHYIDDIGNLYDTINNDKNEEFLPFYTISPQKHDIIRNFICLNRRTKVFLQKNRSIPIETRDEGLTETIKKKIPEKPKIVKMARIKNKKEKNLDKNQNKLDKTELELINSLLEKENTMDKNNFNKIFFLTEKESHPHPFLKAENKIDKNLKTVDINKLVSQNSLHLTNRSTKINYFQQHLNDIKCKMAHSFHEKIKKVETSIKEHQQTYFENPKTNKKFNFSKPKNNPNEIFKSNKEFKPKKQFIMPLNLKNEKILVQNQNEFKQVSRRTENLEGWNEDGGKMGLEEENF